MSLNDNTNKIAAILAKANALPDRSDGVVLDTTLTQSGKAADAKAVGDALAEKQPKGNYLTQDNLQSATDAALAQAKASGEFDGAAGKSAYQYAQDGGYTGTETEFAAKLASGTLIVTITDSNGTLSADKSYIEIKNAIVAGTSVIVDYGGSYLPLILMSDALYFGTIICVNDGTDAIVGTSIIQITENGEVNDISAQIDIPKTLPNPNALTFTGAVTGSYDGTAPMSVNIPSGVTDAHINSLIDTKLGVIENGSY